MKKAILSILSLLLMSLCYEAKAGEFNLDLYLHATKEQPYDVSFWIQNASCHENYGWTRNSHDAAAGYNKHNPDFDSKEYKGIGIETWYWTPVKNAHLIWQEIKDILPGTYVISAYAVGQVYNDISNKGQCKQGLYLMANGSRIPITNNKWQKLSVTCTIKQGETLTIGITADEQNLNDWASLAEINLTCISPGQAEDIAFSENYDVTCVRGLSFANVLLKRYIPSDQLTTLCLPFDVTPTLMQKYFSEVRRVKDITSHGNDFIIETTTCNKMTLGEIYLVKAKDESRLCYEFNNVLVNTTPPTIQTLNGGKLQGSYRQTLTTQNTWILQEDGKTFHRINAPMDLNGFGGNIIK